MACAAKHATFNFVAVTAVAAAVQQREDRSVDHSALAIGAAAACLPSLPDWIEPAVHPNHRKFFHSVTFAVFVCHAMHRTYKWEPQEPWNKVARIALWVSGAAYLAHLARDAFTAKSLPLI